MTETRDKQRDVREHAQARLRELAQINPELEDFLQSPESFTTDIQRLVSSQTWTSDLHQRLGIRYVSDDRHKFITTDTTIHQLYETAYSRPLPSFLAAGPRPHLRIDPKKCRAGIAAGGGIAPGIPVVMDGLVRRHQLTYGTPVGNILGFIGGFRGLGRRGETNTIPLTCQETAKWIYEPGCQIGMSRYREDIDSMVKTLQDLCLDIVYFIGGDGTLEAAHRVALAITQRQLPIAVVGIPKTIDNDVAWCWSTFGFGTAIDRAAIEIRALHANITTHSRIGIIILYGGHSGFLAANAGLASGVADLIVIPEEQPRLEKVVAYARQLVARRDGPLADNALIVMAEGVAWCDGFRQPMLQELRQRGIVGANEEPASFDDQPSDDVRTALVSVLTKAFQAEFQNRHPVVILEPRSLISAVPPSAHDIIYCRRLAENAVDSALAGFTDCMSSFWNTEYVLVPLCLVADKRKQLPIHGAFWTTCRAATGQPPLS